MTNTKTRGARDGKASRAFGYGLMVGFAALPHMLTGSSFLTPPAARGNTVDRAWHATGEHIRSAIRTAAKSNRDQRNGV